MTTLVPSFGKHSDLAADIARFLAASSSTSNGDVIFIVGEKKIPAHKLIVSARSPFFAAIFQHDNRRETALNNRVEIVDIDPDIGPETFEALLRFVYTDKVYLTIEMSKSFLVAATRYSIDLLKWKCEMFLAMENFSQFLLLAHTHDAVNLKKAVVNFIRKSPAEVLKSNGWKQLKKSNLELVCEILETMFS